MHNFVERTTPKRDRLLQFTAARVGLDIVLRDGFGAVSLTRIAELLTVTADFEVSERTLRRRYGTPARLIFGAPWWLPDPYAAAARVLHPRPLPQGPVWPTGPDADAASVIEGDDFEWPPAEFFTAAGIADPLGDLDYASPCPISLRDFLHDLHIVESAHLLGGDVARQLAAIRALAGAEPDVGAWLAAATQAHVERLAPVLATVFGLAGHSAALAAHAYAGAARELEPALSALAVARSRLRGGDRDADVRGAGAALHRARAEVFAQFTEILSVTDRIREPSERGTVVSVGGPDAGLPFRRRGL
ncbi:hypothetical protein [Tsukamurella strandjordii]|uniref:Uncharacterized protein n=1 Tax=Tsukamurella strandjordii TaxID=147577 RepID=A0AA90SL71_9ACTN|nr:hypothetical protein [Tsukamurella strandjordii]MDP0397928.1 hypothetical protein [Tsukamurella strandjordii]